MLFSRLSDPQDTDSGLVLWFGFVLVFLVCVGLGFFFGVFLSIFAGFSSSFFFFIYFVSTDHITYFPTLDLLHEPF